MVSNRLSHQENEGRGKIPIDRLKLSHGHTKQASPISGLGNVINVLRTNDRDSYFETFFRRVVRDEVEHKVQDYLFPRTRVNQAGISGAKPFQLCFINKLPDKIFTLSNIISENESPLQIALFDVRSQSVVNDGPLSSIKIEICALNGDFGSSGCEDWTEVEFNANILREREGKKPLLIGERFITLKNGVCCIPKISFSDNSIWVKSRKFRLGVKASSNGENIKEGTSEPFVVKDNRGESYKKHYPPSLKDDIWRLVKIAKEGKIHKRLSVHGIHNVKDLLQLYTTNASSLYERLGKIPNKSWLAIIEHAETCVIDDHKLYSYQKVGQPIVLLFNSILKLVGVTFDCQNFYSPETLAPGEKHLAEIVKQDAYKNMDNLNSIDETSFNYLNLAACLKSRHSEVPVQDLQGTWPGYIQPYIHENMYDSQVYADPVPDIGEIPQNNLVQDEISLGMYIEGGNRNLNGSHFAAENESSEIQFIDGYPPYTTFGQENCFYFDGAECSNHNTLLNPAVDTSRSTGKPKVEWCKILAPLKWVIIVRRYAAARKNAMLV